MPGIECYAVGYLMKPKDLRDLYTHVHVSPNNTYRINSEYTLTLLTLTHYTTVSSGHTGYDLRSNRMRLKIVDSL